MDEWVDIVDPSGRPTGKTVLKSEAHKSGQLHPTVHIWCYSGDGRVLLQKRDAAKSTFPLKWDVSVAGHISAGESPISGALREIKEEIGITVNAHQLRKIGHFKEKHWHENGIIDAELHHVFLLELDPESVDLHPQAGEVEALEWWEMDRLKLVVSDPEALQDLVPHQAGYYAFVIAAMSND